MFIASSRLLVLGKASKKNFKKKVIIITFGGVSEGHLSLFFFGLKMIFKQF